LDAVGDPLPLAGYPGGDRVGILRKVPVGPVDGVGVGDLSLSIKYSKLAVLFDVGADGVPGARFLYVRVAPVVVEPRLRPRIEGFLVTDGGVDMWLPISVLFGGDNAVVEGSDRFKEIVKLECVEIGAWICEEDMSSFESEMGHPISFMKWGSWGTSLFYRRASNITGSSFFCVTPNFPDLEYKRGASRARPPIDRRLSIIDHACLP